MSGLGNKVIESIINGYFYLSTSGGLGFWDICAGHAIANEIGGSCWYITGEEVIYPCTFKEKSVPRSVVIGVSTDQINEFLKKLNENNTSF